MNSKWNHAAVNWMRRRVIVPVLALILVGGFGAYELAQPTAARASATAGTAAAIDDASISPLISLDKAMETLAARVTPAVVNVTVTARVKQTADDEGQAQQDLPPGFEQFFQQFGFGQGQGRQFRMRPQQPTVEHVGGSGVVISPDGYIVTNNHVVEGATDVQITFSDRRTMSAKVVGTDPLTDLAVLKVDGHNLTNIGWADSTQLHPGQTVLAFGNPLGMRFSVTRGIVSALNRANPFTDDRRKPGEFIQTDAAINQGNSGGPLVDVHGQVVGINTFLLSPSGAFAGMGFAIPSQIARPTVEKLISSGKIEHGYMGVSITDVTPENARFFHMEQAAGALVSEVTPDTPASKAGLKVGDVITGLNGHKVTDAGELQANVSEMSPGTTIKLDVMRDGKNTTLPLTLGEYGNRSASNGASSAENGQKGRWGLGLSDLTPDLRQQLQIPSTVHGAVIMQVQPGSQADNALLSQGYVIEQVNHKDVNSAADVQKALAEVPKGQDALLLVYAGGGSTFIVMHAPAAAQNNG
ncbi:MAG TPA: Do family serine endopeptidase [Terriglobales bacterium]|nr:Do family serine endopeptidase [Terriglobales bacterium]